MKKSITKFSPIGAAITTSIILTPIQANENPFKIRELKSGYLQVADASDASSVILNSDMSFNIPKIKYYDNTGTERFYNVDFEAVLQNNEMLFRPINIIEIESDTAEFGIFHITPKVVYTFIKSKKLAQSNIAIKKRLQTGNN